MRTPVIIALLSIFIVSCGTREKYPEVKDYVRETVAAQDELISVIKESRTGDEIVAGIGRFSEKMIKLARKNAEIRAKYPESEKWDAELPEDLRPYVERLNSKWDEFESAIRDDKNKKIISDTRVKNAFSEMLKNMDRSGLF